MTIETRKIRILIYTFTLSIVIVLSFVLSFMFLKSSQEQSSKKVDEIVMNTYQMRGIYIKDIINNTIQTIEIEKEHAIENNHEIINEAELNFKNLYEQGYSFDELFDVSSIPFLSYKNIEIILYNNTSNTIEKQINSYYQANAFENNSDIIESLETNYLYKHLEIDAYSIYFCLNLQIIDNQVQKAIINRIRKTRYADDGYVWINQVLNYSGGQDYAVRLVHPNLPETEGLLLSTDMKDAQGGKPYQVELEGINTNGDVYHEYYFTKIGSDIPEKKLSYGKLYKPYDWIIATGIYIGDIDDLIDEETMALKKLEKELFSKILLITTFSFGVAFIMIVLFERLLHRLIKKFQNIVNEKNSEILREKKLIEEVAYLDPMTSLLNRRAMNKHLDDAFSRAMRYDETFTVIIGDIDFFKKINDQYGHAAGDLVIKKISDIFSKAVRSDDAVSRWGGEEFLVLLNYADTKNAVKNLERINDALRNADILFDGKKIECTMSYGLASFDKKDESIENIIKKADKNLYIAKKSGRNKMVY